MTRADQPGQVRFFAPTESRNPRTLGIDRVSTPELLRLLNDEDARVPAAVAACLSELAVLVDETVRRVRAGGRLHYVGAGSSGRIAVMDASELSPTYGLDEDVVVAHHAGGDAALRRSAENIEDSEIAGERDTGDVRPGDVVVGLAASGGTPYVAGALRHARAVGAYTALVSANAHAPLAALADVHLLADTGPEAIAGSTRMKAATAQKLILNGLSTALAVRLGRTWSNLMVDMVATNAKLRGRALSILGQATGRPEVECLDALTRADHELKTALVSLLLGCSVREARARLAGADGRVRDATRE